MTKQPSRKNPEKNDKKNAEQTNQNNKTMVRIVSVHTNKAYEMEKNSNKR